MRLPSLLRRREDKNESWKKVMIEAKTPRKDVETSGCNLGELEAVKISIVLEKVMTLHEMR